MSILALLQQMSGVPASPEGDAIVVTGQRDRPGLPTAPTQAQQPVPEDTRQPLPDAPRNLTEHEGLFGVKGTLRNVLGTLGDAFLINAGHDPIFAPQRQMERTGDALYGFTDNPAAAIERLTQVNPQAALALDEYIRGHELDMAKQDAIEGKNQEAVRTADRAALGEFQDRASRLLGAAGDDPAQLQEAMRLIDKWATAYGVNPGDLGLDQMLTPAQARLFAGSDMRVVQQLQRGEAARRADTAEFNAQTSRMNAERPRPARAQSPLEYYQELSRIPEGDRTQEQKAFMRQYTEGKGGSRSSSGRRSVNPDSGSTTSRTSGWSVTRN